MKNTNIEIDNNKNELLFWKVINNKYIFNNIFQLINNNEWVNYSDPNQIHLENRKKFKDIISMKWMIINKQYQLLKCKLENNEYIKIKLKSLKLLFNELNNNNSFDNWEILLSILELLLKKKKLEIELCEFDLIFEQINQFNQTTKQQRENITESILKILVDNSLPINTSVLEFAIENVSPSILLILLGPKLSFKRFTKDKLLLLAFSNKQYKEPMLKFILDNLNNNYSSEKIKSKNKINFLDMLSLESNEIKIKLIEIYKSSLITNILIDNNFNDQEKIKEIHKSLSINSPNEFYFNYLRI